MEKIIEIPDGVEVSLTEKSVKVKGEKGELEREFALPQITIKSEGKAIKVSTASERRMFKALCGTVSAHIQNMIIGVQEGFEYKLKAVYAHFPMTMKYEGNEFIVDNFLGEKYPRKVTLSEGVEVNINGDEVILTGPNKETIGTAATRVEQLTRLSYRDRRIFSDGIYITSKGGKPV